jgi:hypothetical protein
MKEPLWQIIVSYRKMVCDKFGEVSVYGSVAMTKNV